MVYILLAAGFEEMEALTPCDLLRRAGVAVKLVGVDGEIVPGGHAIGVQTDMCVEDVSLDDAEMIVLPGGLVGVENLKKSEKAMDLVREAYEKGIYVAAICAAPTILAELGITNGLLATCHPTVRDQMAEANLLTEAETVQDGRIITGTAAGTSVAFALQLITALRGREKANELADAIVYRT